MAGQRGEALGLQKSHLALDESFLMQATHAAQAGRGGDIHALGQGLVAQACIPLQ
ncbi:hypothetical protein D3C72_2484800 [compost metagenome]